MSKASTGSLAAHMSGFILNAKVLSVFARRLARSRGAGSLAALNDHMLKDIGLTRADVLSLTHIRMGERD